MERVEKMVWMVVEADELAEPFKQRLAAGVVECSTLFRGFLSSFSSLSDGEDKVYFPSQYIDAFPLYLAYAVTAGQLLNKTQSKLEQAMLRIFEKIIPFMKWNDESSVITMERALAMVDLIDDEQLFQLLIKYLHNHLQAFQGQLSRLHFDLRLKIYLTIPFMFLFDGVLPSDHNGKLEVTVSDNNYFNTVEFFESWIRHNNGKVITIYGENYVSWLRPCYYNYVTPDELFKLDEDRDMVRNAYTVHAEEFVTLKNGYLFGPRLTWLAAYNDCHLPTIKQLVCLARYKSGLLGVSQLVSRQQLHYNAKTRNHLTVVNLERYSSHLPREWPKIEI